MSENPIVGTSVETVTWFVLYKDPQYLFSTFEPLGQRDKLRLVRGHPVIKVLEGPIQVPVWLPKDKEPITELTPRVPMWRVSVEGVKECFNAWLESEVDGENIEGWVLLSAFERESDVYVKHTS